MHEQPQLKLSLGRSRVTTTTAPVTCATALGGAKLSPSIWATALRCPALGCSLGERHVTALAHRGVGSRGDVCRFRVVDVVLVNVVAVYWVGIRLVSVG